MTPMAHPFRVPDARTSSAHWLLTGECPTEGCDNPACLPELEQHARACHPDRYAEWLASGRVHPGLSDAEPANRWPGGTVTIGVDMGGRNDATAVVVARPTPDGIDVVDAVTLPLRTPGSDEIGYHAAQFRLIHGFTKRYNDAGCRVLLAVDITREDTASDLLRTTFRDEIGTGAVSLVRVWFTGGDGEPKGAAGRDSRATMPKATLVTSVRGLTDRKRADGTPYVRLTGGADGGALVRQLGAFTKHLSGTGRVQYDAARGHDDLVTAFMLALWLARPNRGMVAHSPVDAGRRAEQRAAQAATTGLASDHWERGADGGWKPRPVSGVLPSTLYRRIAR